MCVHVLKSLISCTHKPRKHPLFFMTGSKAYCSSALVSALDRSHGFSRHAAETVLGILINDLMSVDASFEFYVGFFFTAHQ